MARKDTPTLEDAKRAEAAGWFAKCEWHRADGPAIYIDIDPPKPTGHQLLTEAAEALRKGEWDPADGPYQPKPSWARAREQGTDRPRGPFPNHTEPPATVRLGVKESAAAAARKATIRFGEKTDRGEDR